jgi:antirestriction protein ArdC
MLGTDNPDWLTYKRAQQLGGNVRKGEKGTPVVFWTEWTPKNDKREPDDRDAIPVLRHYTMFHADQCEGIETPALPIVARHEFGRIEACEAIVNGMPANRPTIKHGEPRAYYRPATDTVNMPAAERFDSSAQYYKTLFHELAHSTGHASRLNRKGIAELDQFGSDQYGREELVAEMTAAFLSGHAGINPFTEETSAAYVAGWLKVIKGDAKLVVMAAAQAQKAADWILQTKFATVEA